MATKFSISVDQAQLDDLHQRLALAKFPDEVRALKNGLGTNTA